jgi:hypothetical protein
VTDYNYVHNPRAHLNATDSWSAGGPDRVTSAPWGALPAGADAAYRRWRHYGGAGLAQSYTQTLNGETTLHLLCMAGVSGAGAAWLEGSFSITFEDGSHGFLSMEYETHSGDHALAADQWHVIDVEAAVPEGAVYVSCAFDCYGDTADSYGYMTLLSVGGLPIYADGDSEGWSWEGDAHNSVSFGDGPATPIPPSEVQPTYQLIVGGRAIPHEGLTCSESEWGGFDVCSFTVKSNPKLWERGLQALADVTVYYAGESIFEGRVADVGKEVSTSEGGVRRIDCRGHFDDLKDDGAFRRTFRDKDITGWADDQVDTNAGKFDVVVGDDLSANGGTDIAIDGMTEGQKVTVNGFVFTAVDGPGSAKARTFERRATGGKALTISGFAVDETITVNTRTFRAVASEGKDHELTFDQRGSHTEQAQALAARINNPVWGCMNVTAHNNGAQVRMLCADTISCAGSAHASVSSFTTVAAEEVQAETLLARITDPVYGCYGVSATIIGSSTVRLTSEYDIEVVGNSNAAVSDFGDYTSMAAILQQDDIPYIVSNSRRLVYRITGGVCIPGEYLTGGTITLEDTITGGGSDWEVSLHLRGTPNGADHDHWTSGSEGTHTVHIGVGEDLEPTNTSRCIVLRVKCITAATDYKFTGLAADSPHYGARILKMDIRGSNAATMAPEDLIADLAADFTTAAQRNFPDDSGLLVGQMNFAEPTTRYECITTLNDLLRWQWGFGPGTVFTMRKPWTPANVPDRACYDLPYTLAAPSLTAPLDDCFNAVEVLYVDTKDRPKVYRHAGVSTALGDVTRRQSIQAPEGVHKAAGAAQTAEAYLADHLEPVPTGSVTVQGMVPLVNGKTRHALHIRPGEYMYFRDAPTEEERKVRITRVERTPDTQSSSLEFGRNPSRLDRLLARWDTGTKARRARR